MRTYRVFKLDQGGCVLDAQWIDARDDSDAAKLAIQFGDGTRCEIWERDRLVGMSEPFCRDPDILSALAGEPVALC